MEPHVSRRHQYSIRLAKVAAGSALTAASVVSLTGFTTPPQAEPVTTFQPEPKPPAVPASADASTATRANTATQAGYATNTATNTNAVTASSASTRIGGVRAELQDAVVMGLVTRDQAQGFLAQLQARIARGL